MKVIQLLTPFVMVSLLLSSLAAEEVDAATKCDQTYDACIEKCEKAEDGSSACFEACEVAYNKCLSRAQESNNSTDGE